MGLLSSASIILIQEIVDWSERGSATASFLFARSLGSTFGATVFGAVLNFGLLRLGHAGASSDQLRELLERGRREAAGEFGLRAALEQSLHLTFISMFAVALMVAATAFLVPKVVFAPEARRSPSRPDQAAASARFSPTATASVIARQKVADSERNEPKSLSTISNRTSARPASGESALSVTTTIGHAGAPGALGEIDRERRVRREADRDQRVASARLRELFRPEPAHIVDERGRDPELGERIGQIVGDAERPSLAEAMDRPRGRQKLDRPVELAALHVVAQARDRGRGGIGESEQKMDGIAAVRGRSAAAPSGARNSRATGCAGASGTTPAARRSRRSPASGRSAPGSRPAPRRCGRVPRPCRARIHPGARAHKPRPGEDAWAAAARSRSGGAESRRSSPAARSCAWSLIVSSRPRDAPAWPGYDPSGRYE